MVALILIYIVYIEILLWTKPKGIKTIGLRSKKWAEETKVLAANQGLYNGFFTRVLIWSLIAIKTDVAILFLICVFITGIYDACSTQKNKILYLHLLD